MDIKSIREKLKRDTEDQLRRIDEAEKVQTHYGISDFEECTKHLIKLHKSHDYVYRALSNNIATYESVIESLKRIGKDVSQFVTCLKLAEELQEANQTEYGIVDTDLDIMKFLCPHKFERGDNECKICGTRER